MPRFITKSCAYCGADFTVSTRDNGNGRKYCSLQCSASALLRPITKHCAVCGAAFDADRQGSIYCSMPCYRKSRKGAFAGPDHWQYVPPVQCVCAWCGQPFERKPSEIKKETYCSKECSDKGKTKLTGAKRYNYKGGPYPMACEVCGKICMVKHSLKDRFRACSRACAAEIGRRAWPRTSSLEVAMLRAFAEADLIVHPQYPIGYYTVDFAIPDAMLIIECDGIYWHSLPAQVVRDRNKDAWLQRHGWTILRLTEAEIRRSPAACVQKVQALLR